VVEHHDQERQRVLLGAAEGGEYRVVVERAVADQLHHRAVGRGRLDAEGRAEAGAEAAVAALDELPRAETVETAIDLEAVRDGLLHRDRAGRPPLVQLVNAPACLDDRPLARRRGGLTSRPTVLVVAGAPGFGPVRALAGSDLASYALDEQAQRGLHVAGRDRI